MDTSSVTRAYEAAVDDVSLAQRTITAVINTGSVDRYKTVIDPAGIDLTAYRKNPVVLWEHGKDPTRGRIPIGRNLWIKRSGAKLVGRTEFGKDDYSQSLFDMYRDGTLRGWSIFALPDVKRSSRPTRQEIASRPELADCETIYRACELGEYSAVAVPGNAETLTMLAERSIWFPQERATIGNPPPQKSADPPASSENEPQDEDDEEETGPIRRVDGKWHVMGPDGKPASTHETREKAVKAHQAKERTEERGAPVLPPLEGVTFRVIHAAMTSEINRYYQDRQDLVAATLDLIRGRV